MSASTTLPTATQKAGPLPPSPSAIRPKRGWWRDLRVVAGVVIVIVCVLGGIRLAAAGDATTQVWRAVRDLPAGLVPGTNDLVAVAVPTDAAGAYVPAAQPVTAALDRAVRAGELVPRPAAQSRQDLRWVTIPVESLHAPPDLTPGDFVEVWATPAADLGATSAPRRVLASALVASASTDSVDFGGDYGVIVQVAPDEVTGLLTAIRTGSVDLVRLPGGEAS